MTSLSFVLVLGLFSTALCGDLPEGENFTGGHGSLLRNPGMKSGEGPSLDPLEVNKRSAEMSGQSCTSLLEIESALRNNTHTYSFRVGNMGFLSLAWVADGVGVLLALTTFQMPLFMMQFGQSALYRSEDYGKTFQDVTYLLNHTFIQVEFGIAISPDHSGKVILTGDLPENGGARLFRSQDFGRNFDPTDLLFEPLIQVLYDPRNCSVLMTLSVKFDLWLSEDFGATWGKIHNSVCSIKWGPNSSIYLTTNANRSCHDKGMLELRKTLDYGRSFQTIATRVFSFVLGGRFLFASIMTGTGTERKIHVSVDGGEVWNIAQLPSVNHEQFYSILSANQDMVFMHVDDPGDSGVGTIYVSDDRGTVFSKSLDGHLYTATGSDTDFTSIASLKGVYMTSILTEDGTVETVITFDQGAKWQTLQRIQNNRCDTKTTTNRPDRCRLHVHASYSTTMNMNVPMLPLSQLSAVGLIIAHGSVGDPESVLFPDVYVSDDGGYSWLLALRGPHHYAILESGGLLVAVEHTNAPVHQIKFSTDEGQCWHVYNFTDDPLHISGMDSEPGARSMNISLWGYRNDLSKWVVITIDFRKLLSRVCGDEDYAQWLAHSDDPSNPTDGCILGYKEHFLRLRKNSVCRNGRDYVISKQSTPCPCTLDDYHCDFGFYRPENYSFCIEQEEMKNHRLELCLNGTTMKLETNGYRKIPGDKCEGGFHPENWIVGLGRRCISSSFYQDLPMEESSPNIALIVMVVIGILVLTAVGSVWLIKKHVCGGRFLVHRYSVMRDHVEADRIEGVDDPVTQSTETGKPHFQYDSDQLGLLRTESSWPGEETTQQTTEESGRCPRGAFVESVKESSIQTVES